MFLAAYAVLEWVSLIAVHKCVPVTPWNPGLGVVFALMVFVGLWGSFVLFIGVITAEFFVLESKLECFLQPMRCSNGSASSTSTSASRLHLGIRVSASCLP